MSRKQFIQQHGAACKNWQWSWSFVNHAEHVVIFGAWAHHTKGNRTLILSESWQTLNGRRQNGYGQSFEHILLVRDHGYALQTFPMSRLPGNDKNGRTHIKTFTPVLTPKRLIAEGIHFYAANV